MKNLLFRTLVIITVLAIAGCSAPPAPPMIAEPGSTIPAEPTPGEAGLPPASEDPSDNDQSSGSGQPQDEVVFIAQSDRSRVDAPPAAQEDIPELVNGNSAFALDMYQALRSQPGNLFYSPYSISLALAMTYAGARGETEAEMADVLHFVLPQAQLHPAFNSLDTELNREVEGSEQSFELNIANSLWGQQGYHFEANFLDTLAENYGAGLRLVDYINAADEAGRLINAWVEEETQEKIKDLIPEGALDELVRLVLANAIYFKAAWINQFEEVNTQDAPFNLLDGSQVSAATMRQTEGMPYASGPGWQAAELAYEGGRQSMLILLPAEGEFEAFEASLDAERVNEIIADLEWNTVELSLPKFSFESEYELDSVLAGMGMPTAFDEMRADFSGMTGERELFIGAVLHKAFVDVNEEGTEAAAATAVIMRLESMPLDPQQMQVDRPFMFMIRDNETGSILFVGRVLNPLD
jgi:serpin B